MYNLDIDLYKSKYLKYKTKYFSLKKSMIGRGIETEDTKEKKGLESFDNNIRDYIYNTDCRNVIKLMGSSKSVGENINFDILTSNIEIDNTINIINNKICDFVGENELRKHQCNTYYNKCRIKSLFDKYYNIECNGLILNIPNVYTKEILNQILLRTIPNNLLEDIKDNIDVLLALGADITKIPDHAFQYNQLINIRIPECITHIGKGSFWGNKLIKIIIPDSISIIDDASFKNNRLTEINIPDSVTKIGAVAFENNKLTKINIPKSVTVIGDRAFATNIFTLIRIPECFKKNIHKIFNIASHTKVEYY